MNKQELLAGKVFKFDNEEFQVAIKNDDIRSAEVRFEEPFGCFHKEFKIEFNGALIHMSKTFKSFEKRLNKLINDWHLKEVEL